MTPAGAGLLPRGGLGPALGLRVEPASGSLAGGWLNVPCGLTANWPHGGAVATTISGSRVWM